MPMGVWWGRWAMRPCSAAARSKLTQVLFLSPLFRDSVLCCNLDGLNEHVDMSFLPLASHMFLRGVIALGL